MISAEAFVTSVLEGIATVAPPTLVGSAALPGEFDGFPDPDTGELPLDDASFAQRLLENSGFGQAQLLPRNEVILGEDPSARSLPERVFYWPKTAERPYQTLLFELDKSGLELLDDTLFQQLRAQRLLEDALHRLVQYALAGFERGGQGRSADVRRGPQTETLCVVSVVDDRQAPARRLVCFGTRCVATNNALEVFTLREEARDWAKYDRPLAEEHLKQLYQRHFSKLTSGEKWQEAFVSNEERDKVRKLVKAASGMLQGSRDYVEAVRGVLDEIAKSFGYTRRGDSKHRVTLYELPEDHDIGVDPEAAKKPKFANPLYALSVLDSDHRLLGYVLQVRDKKASAAAVREDLAQHNRFHNVLVIYPEAGSATLELWQGHQPLTGRLISGNRVRFDGEGGIVQLLSRFFVVGKSPIDTPKALADELAYRARHLRRIALDELARGSSGALKKIHAHLNRTLAAMTDEEFADAYAQTITYGLLSARWLSADATTQFTRQNVPDLLPSTSPFLKAMFKQLVASQFDKNLSWLLDDVTGLLRRTSVAEVFKGELDPSIHFYQDFLDAYDPQIRKDRGVYYTPDEVVSYMVRNVDHELRERFGLELGLADTTSWKAFAKARRIPVPDGVSPDEPFVQVLDPATGTGTFLMYVIRVVYETMRKKHEQLDEEAFRKKWVTYVRSDLLPRLNGIELMMAPYIVCHLRLGLALQRTGFKFVKGDRLRVFLTNTLEMHTDPQTAFAGEHVAEEAQLAEAVKFAKPVSVVIGNPPYQRESANGGKAGWVLSGWRGWNNGTPLMEDLFDGARRAGAGGNIQTIYNLYVYFWRWALWRAFERFQSPGIVSFITASSFVAGPGFAGLRHLFRQLPNRVEILDLGGDQKGARVSDNVFNILIGVCVGTLVRSPPPADTRISRYHLIAGDRREKLAACNAFARGDVPAWSVAAQDQLAPLLPTGLSAFDAWPKVTEIFPVQYTGYHFYRAWPIAPQRDVLHRRWRALVSAPLGERPTLLKETRDRTVDKAPAPLAPGTPTLLPIAKLGASDTIHRLERTGFRSFDRQWCIADTRVGDFIRPSLWFTAGERQVYLATMMAGALGAGPAATVSAYVPDCHFFCGRGGKDIIPLWRDAAGSEPNMGAGAGSLLASSLGAAPEDVFAYTYAVLANPGFVLRFSDELQVPGPRLPITKDKDLFARGASLGRALLRWHTFGERFREKGDGFVLAGNAKVIRPIPTTPEGYPERHRYDAKTRVLTVGDGQIGPVTSEIMDFSVSGLQVVKSWLDYRMKKGAGKKSSPLDDIRPERWTDDLTRELLEVLWVLEWTLGQYPNLDAWLEEVLAGPLFTSDEFPAPTEAERKEPKVERSRGARLV